MTMEQNIIRNKLGVVRFDRSENANRAVAGRELPITLSEPRMRDDGTKLLVLLCGSASAGGKVP